MKHQKRCMCSVDFFIDQECVLGDGYVITFGSLYDTYRDFSECHGQKAASKSVFGSSLKMMQSIELDRKTLTTMVQGLALKADEREAP